MTEVDLRRYVRAFGHCRLVALRVDFGDDASAGRFTSRPSSFSADLPNNRAAFRFLNPCDVEIICALPRSSDTYLQLLTSLDGY